MEVQLSFPVLCVLCALVSQASSQCMDSDWSVAYDTIVAFSVSSVNYSAWSRGGLVSSGPIAANGGLSLPSTATLSLNGATVTGMPGHAVSGLLTANGGVTLGSGQTLTMPSNGVLSLNTATVSGTPTFSGLVTLNGGATLGDSDVLSLPSTATLALNGAAVTGMPGHAVSGLLTANGGITLGSGQTLTIPSNGVLSLSSATVSGTPTFTGLLTANGGITLGSAQTLAIPSNGVLSLNGATVSGTPTFSGLLTANGGVTLGSGQTLTIPSNGVLSLNAATVSGTPTFTGMITANAGITVPSGGALVSTGSGRWLDLGYGQAGRQTDAGKIGYASFTAGMLDILGAGTSLRSIKLWDNVYVSNGLYTSATTTGTGIQATGNGAPAIQIAINGAAADPTNYGRGLQITNAVGSAQQASFIRAGQTVYSLGYHPGTNTFGLGSGTVADGSFGLNYWAAGGGNMAIGTSTITGDKLNVAGGVRTGGARSYVVETVVNNCAAASCSATCPAGKVVLLGIGVHGAYQAGVQYNVANNPWSCGNAQSLMGQCIGASSCSFSTGCSTSSMYILCT